MSAISREEIQRGPDDNAAEALVRLADEQGRGSVVHLPYLPAADGFEQLGERVAVPVLPAGSLHGRSGGSDTSSR